MKICCFDNFRLGLIEDDIVIDVSRALTALPPSSWPYTAGDAVIANWPSLNRKIPEIIDDAPRYDVAEVRLRSPVANPSKIIGIARNRKNLDQENLGPGNDFAKGRGDSDPMHMFIKATSALVGPSDGVAPRFTDRRNDPEAELAIVIGKVGTDIAEDNAADHVFGYAIGIDMSLRGAEPASSRKSIDSYAVLGPWITTPDEIADADNIATLLSVDGEILQDANTNQLAFGIRSIIANVSTFYTLHPGDVIMTGTAASFAPIHPGTIMVADFAGLGRIEVAVRAHRSSPSTKTSIIRTGLSSSI